LRADGKRYSSASGHRAGQSLHFGGRRGVAGGHGFGHVNGLVPSHSYLLQRAVDTTLDGNCTSTMWLTLGKGLVAQSLTTDDTGTAREDLFRNLAALPTGSRFDIHFRVIDATTLAVALESGCYEYTVDE